MSQTTLSKTTGLERVLATLRCEKPDRVPWLEVVVDESVALALLGKPQPKDGASSEFVLGDEMTLIGPLLGSPRYEALELAQNLGLDGLGMHFWVRHEGIQHEIEGRHMVVGGRIRSRADLARLELPDPDDERLYEPCRAFVKRYRDSGLARFCFLNLGSDPAILGMGFESFCLALHDDRALVEGLLDLYSDWYARAVRNLCELEFDFLWAGDDIAFKTSTFVSPPVFHESLMPYYRRVAEQMTKPWMFHSDGNLMPVLDDLLSLGMSGLHPIEPGAMDLGILKRRYGDHLCLCGHVSVDALSRGTPQEVEHLVREAIHIAAPGGGYVAGSSNSITAYCKPENVRAMQRAIAKYGRY
jgi:uroporphyrinogen decarboxylase